MSASCCWRYGLVRTDPGGAVTEFVEKPSPDEIDTSNISAGAYVLERSVLELLEPDQPASIERDVFPRLVGEGLYACVSESYRDRLQGLNSNIRLISHCAFGFHSSDRSLPSSTSAARPHSDTSDALSRTRPVARRRGVDGPVSCRLVRTARRADRQDSASLARPGHMTQHFCFAPSVRLCVRGPKPIEQHFLREFGDAAATPSPDVDVDVVFGTAAADRDALLIGGRHKTVGWRIALSRPAARPLTASIEVLGRPRFFVVSLAQGYFVEPLIAMAAARAGHVLLPSAAIADGDGAVLLIGASGSGKSSLAARAIAAARPVLGDDQVFLDAAGACRAFPRRMRFYWDLPQVAPSAFARLSARGRFELRWRIAMRHATRGYLRPSLTVSPEELGASRPAQSFPLRRVLVMERADSATALEFQDIEREAVVKRARLLLRHQRERVAASADAAWHQALLALESLESDVVRRGIDGVRTERLVIPGRWDAPRAVGELARALGIEP